MWPFSSGESNDCGGHHFGKERTTAYRLCDGRTHCTVERRIEQACLHDGCDEVEWMWEKIDYCYTHRGAKKALAQHLAEQVDVSLADQDDDSE